MKEKKGMATPRAARLVLACLALLCITALSASAQRIYTTSASDGSLDYINSDLGPAYYADSIRNYAFASNTENIPVTVFDHYERTIDYAVFQFPVSSLRGKTLSPNSALLRVYFTYVGTASPGLTLSGFSFDGGGTLDASQFNAPKTTITSLMAQPNAWSNIDVTADLQRQINAGYNWAGFCFSTTFTVNNGQTYMATYENSAYRPYLDIVPEPSSLMALGGGLVGLLGLIGRRRQTL